MLTRRSFLAGIAALPFVWQGKGKKKGHRMSNGLLNGLGGYYAPKADLTIPDYTGNNAAFVPNGSPVFAASGPAVEGEIVTFTPVPAWAECAIPANFLPLTGNRTYFWWAKVTATNAGDVNNGIFASDADINLGILSAGDAVPNSFDFSLDNPPANDAFIYDTPANSISLGNRVLGIVEVDIVAKTMTMWANNVQIGSTAHYTDAIIDDGSTELYLGYPSANAATFNLESFGYYTALMGLTRRSAMYAGGAGLPFSSFDSGGGPPVPNVTAKVGNQFNLVGSPRFGV